MLFTSLFYAVSQNILENRAQNPNQEQQTNQSSFETKKDERGLVSITATPQILGKDGAQWKFNIALDTHSVELDQDLMQIATLTDDKGSVYKPTAWEGAGPGGHHREGVLVFGPINPFPQSIELKIKDMGGIPERSFKWGTR